ncbi:hypothetical protein AB4Z34_01540 [Ensifer sp. 2YAB10]|uniref:hypothetical protein n=1 Tax=unclassified Ensifer TaxID=2633371 RepID=UPI003F9179F0
MRRILIAVLVVGGFTQVAEAKRAECFVADRHDRSQKLMSFEVDDDKYPYILNINGVDEGATPAKVIDIQLYDKANGRIETWYLSRVERSVDRQRSIYRMHFGEMRFDTREVADQSNYTLYMDWEHGKAGWLDEDLAFNLFDTVEEKPNLVVWPVSCKRLD